MQPRPSAQDYTDYREYLRDMVAHLKSTSRAFSYRAFARRGGFSSSGFLKHVLDGQRNISAASVEKFAKGLGLSEQESSAFELLVLLTQAATDDERTRLLRRLRASRLRKRLTPDEFELYSTPLAVPIRELLTMSDAPQSAAAIGRRLWPRAGARPVKKALDLLVSLGLVEETREGYRSKRGTLETDPEIMSLAIRNYHRGMLQRALQSLDELEREQRNVTSITVKMSPKDYQMVCQKISDFEDELLATLAESEPSAAQAEIFNLCVALVPATKQEDAGR